MRKANLKYLVLSLVFLLALSGCVQKDSSSAQDYARESELYYQKAVGKYQELIRKGKDLERWHLELGALYYRHGEYELAVEELKKFPDNAAKKILGIAYYRLGNFTDALEIFNKQESEDSEYLYYYGLACEKLNLFDRALGAYKKIKSQGFAEKAKERINEIEKEVSQTHIRDVSAEIGQAISSAPKQEEYPQAGALILYCDEKIKVLADNTQEADLHYVIKILNERGKEAFAETGINYDSTDEKVELEFARTIKPDGTVVEVGKRHIRDVSKYLNFPLYSNARVFIISFPEITEGSTIEYNVKIYSHELINKKDIVQSYPVQSSEPIIAANFSVQIPKDRALRIKTLNAEYNNFNADLKPQVDDNGESLVYTWRFKNIPQIISEPNMPPQVEINPTLLLSTFNSWQGIYDWWWKLAQDKISADSAIKQKVKELTQPAGSEEEKLRSIYNFCAQKIRYVAVEYGQAGYEPHNAGDIFKNKYGDCKDQAILLVTMLKEAGFTAWPLLIATREYYNLNEDFPSVLFNHCIAAVSFKGKIYFLDPTAETCAFDDLPSDDQGRRVLIFTGEGYRIEETPLYPAGHNLISQNTVITINRDETLSGKKIVSSYGYYDQAQRYWLLYTQPELVEQALKEKIQEFSIGAELGRYNIENLDNLNKPVALSYAFSGPEYFTNAGPLRIMPQLASIDSALVAQDKRKYAIDFALLDTREADFTFSIPDNFSLKYLPQSITEDSPWLKFAVEYQQKDGKIYFRQRAELKERFVSGGQYPDFKNFLESLAKKIKQRIVLERIR